MRSECHLATDGIWAARGRQVIERRVGLLRHAQRRGLTWYSHGFAFKPVRFTVGIKPAAGLKLRLDAGVLFSNGTGTLTGQRVHWSDRLTSVMNDVPTEAEFFPARWGTAVLK